MKIPGKPILIFIGGLLAGSLITFFILFIMSKSAQHREWQAIREKVLADFLKQQQPPAAQYLEVRGKKGTVTLHTGMHKDSVKLLVGKPDKVNLYSIGNETRENWDYDLEKENGTDLQISFEDGLLKSVHQY